MIELADSHPRTFQLCKSFSINHGDCDNDSFVNEGNLFHFHIIVLRKVVVYEESSGKEARASFFDS